MISSVSLTPEEVMDRILAMRKQEETSYSYRDHLPKLANGEVDDRLNVTWREKICQWSYNVVDHFELSREVVAISLDLFDRYLAKQGNKCSGNLALLTSLTTLQLAIKLHDSKKIKISTLANLSRGQFGPEHIEDMEWNILDALQWKLHPPTQYAFVAHLLLLLPRETSSSVRRELLELSRYMTELAVCDSYFVSVNNSTVAFASILNVMEEMSYIKLSAGTREKFIRDVAWKVGLRHGAFDVVEARARLRTMFVATSDEGNYAGIQQGRPQESDGSVSAHSMSSVGSNGSHCTHGNRPRANSTDSKGSYRYSPSPHRRHVVTNISPMAPSRSRASASPVVASVQ